MFELEDFDLDDEVKTYFNNLFIYNIKLNYNGINFYIYFLHNNIVCQIL